MKRLTLLNIFILSCTTVFAQQANPELKGLINKSFSYYPAFNELNQAIQVEADRVSLTQASRNPTLDATGSYRYIHPVSKITIPTGNAQPLAFQIMPNHNYSTTLNASYVLWDFGKVKTDVDRAKTALQYARDNVDYNKNQMAYQVASIYYEIIYLEKAIAIQDSVLNFLNANKKDTEVKLKHGDALRYDVLSIQSTVDQAQNAKIDLQNSLKKQINLLQYTTGVENCGGADFDFTLPDMADANNALSSAQSNNVEFKLLKDRIAQAEAALAVSRQGGKPSLVANAGTGFTNGYTPQIDRFKYNYSAGVTLSIPIYEGGRNKRQVRLSQSQLKETSYGLATLNNDYLKNIKQALADIESNRNSIVNAERQVAEAKQAQQLAQSRYKNGTGTNLELTNASTNVQTVSLTQLRYQFQLCQANLELARLTGIAYW
ncbi:TolC family protein [Mucilaginibacter paludis]|uniref:Outer membrane efflux protein n=1 Tax=Mucilaginibacter paludis DSM 18603 TaxID=714943 RepID=H1Y5W9_9SPHI|nr:TolC family protein [Mucilaginibacter paludis]EHQ30391.1 outer membrane efflux protein [Mucilaginibacter paludis DSM 18603]